jgi:hypothetical protein
MTQIKTDIQKYVHLIIVVVFFINDNKSLHNLSLTCKYFSLVAREKLFKTISSKPSILLQCLMYNKLYTMLHKDWFKPKLKKIHLLHELNYGYSTLLAAFFSNVTIYQNDNKVITEDYIHIFNNTPLVQNLSLVEYRYSTYNNAVEVFSKLNISNSKLKSLTIYFYDDFGDYGGTKWSSFFSVFTSLTYIESNVILSKDDWNQFRYKVCGLAAALF